MKNILLAILFVLLMAVHVFAGPPGIPPQSITVNGTTCPPGGSCTITDSTRAPALVYDTIYLDITTGLDSALGAPLAWTKVQGPVGSAITTIAAANVSYGTFTVNANGYDVTAAVYVSGTQTATFTLSGLTSGKMYRFQFTPTVTGQVPTFTATSGISGSTIPTIVTATVETIYFRASATTAVFTASNTGASTWSTATTTLYEYGRPVVARQFSHTIQQTLVFDWLPPLDWDGTIAGWQWAGVVDNATAPANGETIICQLGGYAIGSSDSLSQAMGTSVSSAFTADATYAQYDEIISTMSGAVTIANSPAAGKKVKLALDCLTTGTYAQAGPSMAGLWIKHGRTLAH
jgi:hypothetical protein